MQYEFHEWDHDTSRKTFFGTRKNWDGPEIIDHILRDHPGKRRVAARFITRKIWEYLAAPLPRVRTHRSSWNWPTSSSRRT